MKWNYLYMKDGKTLIDYCRCNNLSYNGVYWNIDKYGLTPDEAVARYLQRRGKRGENNLKIIYRGVSARKYCIKKGLSYNCFMRYLYKGYSIDEAMDATRIFKFKRGMTGGINLYQYCLKHKLNYYQELKKLKLKLANDNRLPLEQPLSIKVRELLGKGTK